MSPTSSPTSSFKSSPAARRSGGLFSNRKKAQKAQKAQTKKAQKAQKDEKAFEEERAAKAALQAEENKRLSKAVNERIRERRLSHEQMGQEEEALSKREILRRSRLVSQLVSSEEVQDVHRLVAKREEERAERVEAERAERAVRAERQRASTDAVIADEISQTSPSPASAAATKSKKPTARERMAQMQREADERKRIAQGLDGCYEDIAASNISSSSKATAQQVGTAKSAAKIAGGVFYTREEHVRVHGAASNCFDVLSPHAQPPTPTNTAHPALPAPSDHRATFAFRVCVWPERRRSCSHG